MAELTKQERELAYKAGYALPAINFDALEAVPKEQRVPGVHHCPFAEGDPQREHWLRGLADRLDGADSYDPAAVAAEVRKELG